MTKMQKLLAAAALTAGSAADLAAPAHADALTARPHPGAPAAQAHPGTPAARAHTGAQGHWTATGTAACADELIVEPVVKTVSPLPLGKAAPACPADSLIQGRR
jgi:hypothetical protein